jgi:putative spermidine/putrescine transport system ATP-binding protein
VLAVRPEHISLAPPQDGADINQLRGTVAQLVYSGNLVQVLVDLPTGEQVTAEARPAECALEPGAEITLSWRARDGVLIRDDHASSERL